MNDAPTASMAEPEFKVGEIIRTNKGNYENQRLLGMGGMGAVYQVTDPEFGHRRWALKTLLPDYCVSRASFERLEAEGRVLSGIAHKNIIRVEGVLYLAGTEPRRPAILMELLEGRTLRNLFTVFGKNEFVVEDICRVAIAVCNALTYVHDRQIIHRDVKPENIFIEKSDSGGRVVLLDFGIMRTAVDAAPRIGKSQTEGHFVGTFSNASPEQLLGQEITIRSDIYSFATVLYEMVARRPLFPHLTNERAVGQAHIDDTPTHLREIVPHLPGEILDIIMQSLEKDPENRPKDAYHLVAPFQRIAHRLFVEKAKNAGSATFQKMLSSTIAEDRWAALPDVPPQEASKGQTVRMASPQQPLPPAADITSPSGPPLGGAAPEGSRLAAPSRNSPSAIAGVPLETEMPRATAAHEIGGGIGAANVLPPHGHSAGADPPDRFGGAPADVPSSFSDAARRHAAAPHVSRAAARTPFPGHQSSGERLYDARVVTASGLREGAGTDPTSTQSIADKRGAHGDDASDGAAAPTVLPLHRSRTRVAALVAAVALAAASIVVLTQRSRPPVNEPQTTASPTFAPPSPVAAETKPQPMAPTPLAPPPALTPTPTAAASPTPEPAPSASPSAAPAPARVTPAASASEAPSKSAVKPPPRPRPAPAPRPAASHDPYRDLFIPMDGK